MILNICGYHIMILWKLDKGTWKVDFNFPWLRCIHKCYLWSLHLFQIPLVNETRQRWSWNISPPKYQQTWRNVCTNKFGRQIIFFLIRNSPERSENQWRWCLLLFFLFTVFMKRNFLCKVAITVITFIILARSKANEIN